MFLMSVLAFTVAFVACEKDNDSNLVSVSVTAGEGGTVAGDNGKHSVGENLKFVAIPDNGYVFSCWSDGIKSNPRTITVQNNDIILVALFAKSDGNNSEYNNENNGENHDGNGNGEQNIDNNPNYFTTGCWEGYLPIRENEGSNYSSLFYFSDDNGSKYGIENSYYKGGLDNSYDFLWEWNNDTHSVLVLNYGGKWAEDKCYVEILEFNEDHIYGYYYKTPADYIENRVKVELKRHIATNVNISSLTIVAQSDGTISIEGNITANSNITKMELQDLEGKTIADLPTKNIKSIEKEENGKKVRVFSMDIASVTIPIQKIQLVYKTKDGDIGKGIATIGEDYAFNVGTGSNVFLGSFISLVSQRCYMLMDFYNNNTGVIDQDAIAKTIEIVLKGDTQADPTPANIASAKTTQVANTPNAGVRTQEQCDANKTKLADAKIYDNVVFTTTGCIATYTLTKVDDVTYTISGIMINNKSNYKIDVSGVFAN